MIGLIQMSYYLSGADLNPMVSLINMLRGKHTPQYMLLLWLVQSFAGFCGGAIGLNILGTAPLHIPDATKVLGCVLLRGPLTSLSESFQ